MFILPACPYWSWGWFTVMRPQHTSYELGPFYRWGDWGTWAKLLKVIQLVRRVASLWTRVTSLQGYTVQSGAKLSNAQRGVLLLIPILQLSKLRLRGIKRLALYLWPWMQKCQNNPGFWFLAWSSFWYNGSTFLQSEIKRDYSVLELRWKFKQGTSIYQDQCLPCQPFRGQEDEIKHFRSVE